jgi:aldose sugar dehydrogenase
MHRRLVLAVVSTALLVSSFRAWSFDGAPVRSDRTLFHVTTFATGLEHPWGAAFLPDGRLLVTERPGRMRVVDQDGRVSASLGGVPPVEIGGWEGGLLDVAVAPDFATTRETWVQAVVATPVCPDLSSASKASAGVLHPSVLRGRLLSVAATAARASAL